MKCGELMKKNLLFIIPILIMCFCFNIGDVLAECNDCTYPNCESCGCKADSSSKLCVYSNYESGGYSCGDGYITNIPAALVVVVRSVYVIIQVITPVILIIFGLIDLVKGIASSKEDEIKKGQQAFIKRLVSAVILFFVFSLVKLVVSVASDNSKVMDCAECFLKSNGCDSKSSSRS